MDKLDWAELVYLAYGMGAAAVGGYLGLDFDGVYFRIFLATGVFSLAVAGVISMWRRIHPPEPAP